MKRFDLTTLEGNEARLNHGDSERVRLKEEGMTIDFAKLRVGDKVRYQPGHYGLDQWENGIIKEIREDKTDGVWVVYHCAENWSHYNDYTSALTNLRDLKLGWKP